MASRAPILPDAAVFPASGGAYYAQVGDARGVVRFVDGSTTTAYFAFPAPQGLTGTLTLVLLFVMASAVSGAIRVAAAVEAVTPGDALDIDAATGFDADNAATSSTVPGTAGYPFSVSITLTNADSIAAGDWVRVAIKRIGADGADTATGIADLVGGELRDGA